MGMNGAPINAPIRRSSGWACGRWRSSGCGNPLDKRRRQESKTSADDDGDEHESDLAVIVSVELGEDDGVREEKGVEHGIDENDIHAHEIQHWLRQDHSDGPNQARPDDSTKRMADRLLLGDDVGVSCLLPQASGPSLQKDRGVCLRDEGDEAAHQACEGQVDPEEEIEPPGAHVDPAADDRANHGTDVRGRSEVRNRLAAFLDLPDVGDGTAGEGQDRAGEDAAEEAGNKEAADVR